MFILAPCLEEEDSPIAGKGVDGRVPANSIPVDASNQSYWEVSVTTALQPS
jgi:hypothetical protein